MCGRISLLVRIRRSDNRLLVMAFRLGRDGEGGLLARYGFGIYIDTFCVWWRFTSWLVDGSHERFYTRFVTDYNPSELALIQRDHLSNHDLLRIRIFNSPSLLSRVSNRSTVPDAKAYRHPPPPSTQPSNPPAPPPPQRRLPPHRFLSPHLSPLTISSKPTPPSTPYLASTNPNLPSQTIHPTHHPSPTTHHQCPLPPFEPPSPSIHPSPFPHLPYIAAPSPSPRAKHDGGSAKNKRKPEKRKGRIECIFRPSGSVCCVTLDVLGGGVREGSGGGWW